MIVKSVILSKAKDLEYIRMAKNYQLSIINYHLRSPRLFENVPKRRITRSWRSLLRNRHHSLYSILIEPYSTHGVCPLMRR